MFYSSKTHPSLHHFIESLDTVRAAWERLWQSRSGISNISLATPLLNGRCKIWTPGMPWLVDYIWSKLCKFDFLLNSFFVSLSPLSLCCHTMMVWSTESFVLGENELSRRSLSHEYKQHREVMMDKNTSHYLCFCTDKSTHTDRTVCDEHHSADRLEGSLEASFQWWEDDNEIKRSSTSRHVILNPL